MCVQSSLPGREAQSVGHLTRKSGVPGSIPGLATYFRFSFRFFKNGSCQLLAKVCARSLPRKSVVRLTDRPDMTLDVYRGRKTTMQQQQNQSSFFKDFITTTGPAILSTDTICFFAHLYCWTSLSSCFRKMHT